MIRDIFPREMFVQSNPQKCVCLKNIVLYGISTMYLSKLWLDQLLLDETADTL